MRGCDEVIDQRVMIARRFVATHFHSSASLRLYLQLLLVNSIACHIFQRIPIIPRVLFSRLLSNAQP